MDQFWEIALFAGKALVIVVSIIVVLLTFVAVIAKNKLFHDPIEATDLGEKLQKQSDKLKEIVLTKKQLKKELKKNKDDKKPKNKVYVLDFDGDIKASAVKEFRNEISAVLAIATKQDEVVVRLESPGGMVHAYGLAAAQLLRIRNQNIRLTICVDKVAASGGYLMACIADKIISAPFAIVGSIGVIAQVPNFNKLLKKNNIDYEEITAGEYKRTISIFGEITDGGRKKFTEEIQETHALFKNWVEEHRPQLNINEVATGEHWYGKQAIDKKLVDELSTSDDYISSQLPGKKVIQVKIKPKKSLQEKFTEGVGSTISKNFPDWIQQANRKHWY